MKWLFVCLAVFFMVAPAMAGEDPYIAIVGNDCYPGETYLGFPGVTCPSPANVAGLPPAGSGAAMTAADFTAGAGTKNRWYVSPKQEQFHLNQLVVCGVPICDPSAAALLPAYTNMTNRFPQTNSAGCEQFRSQTAINQAEVCYENPTLTGVNCLPPFPASTPAFGNLNAVVRAGNAGYFEWWIRLPKKPSGEINIVFECGVLKPNSFAFNCFDSIEVCAAETGERVGPNCTRIEVDPGVSPVQAGSLPQVAAVAYPGPFNSFTPFHLTAFRNPGSYTIAFDAVTGAMSNNAASQVLDGSTSARVLLKACMDKTVVAKLPVTGQLNACSNAAIPTTTPPLPSCFGGGNETETDLEMGDLIQVRLQIPRNNSVDIYCNFQSAKLAGVGEASF